MTAAAARVLDAYLVVSAQAGDQAAFARLVVRWHKRLVAHGWRLLGDQDAAADAVQAAWTEIVRGLARLDDAEAFPAWAYRIVTRCCARQIGRVVRQRALATALAGTVEATTASVERGRDAARLHAAIRLLPAEQRAAIALFHFEEMSVAEVAVALDVPVGTVKTRLMHGRRKLRAVLEGDEPCTTPID
jgi:RNA polymerase sigma-70 factor (ECF subfamily)